MRLICAPSSAAPGGNCPLLPPIVSTDLEDHLDGKDAGEDEVKRVEDSVARRVLVDRVFSSQRYAAGTDDDHNEQVKVAQIDDEMTKTTQPQTHTHKQTNIIAQAVITNTHTHTHTNIYSSGGYN